MFIAESGGFVDDSDLLIEHSGGFVDDSDGGGGVLYEFVGFMIPMEVVVFCMISDWVDDASDMLIEHSDWVNDA